MADEFNYTPVNYDPFERAAARTRQSVMPAEGGRAAGPATHVLEEFVPHVAKGLWDFASYPGKLYRGEADASPEAMVDWSTGAALNMMGARSPFIKPGEVGTFGGRPPVQPEFTPPPEPVGPFYSAVGDVLSGVKTERAPGPQWLNTILPFAA